MTGDDNRILTEIAAETPTRAQRKAAKRMTWIGVTGLALFAFSQFAGMATRTHAWWIVIPFVVSLILIGISAAYWNPRMWSWMAKNWLP